MPKKLDSDQTGGEKLIRLFCYLLVNGKHHYQSELATKFNCSPQTIIRLMSTIENEVGTSLQSGRDGRRKWYRIAPKYKPMSLGINMEELRYLNICRDLASPYLPAQIKKRIDKNLWNISLMLSDVSQTDEEIHHYGFFSKGYIDYSRYFSQIDAITKAIDNNLICELDYKASGQNSCKHHIFAPCKIASMNGALYVLGSIVCDDFKTYKHQSYFVIHRIISVTVTSIPCTFKHDEIDFESFGLPWHEPRRFKIRFRPGKATDYVSERIWAHHQKITELPDGGIILEITTCSEPELQAWVRSFGDEAMLLNLSQ